jgi:chromosome segregation protein
MAARFVRLRIAGFKSFAEPATIEILPGLTGVVGPNGCGKSNVAEALRWAMGEGNARTLRGAEMDDVIFAGTASRPSRNLAEVALTLEDDSPPESPGSGQGSGDGPGDTSGPGFPAPFTGMAELQVIRRIERGVGSEYRVNGREARARDVQTLFADLASGARSSAMVSQGRVAAVIAARPEERRLVLEEAAGITGLHARRAEAEGKLRAAEQNLERAEEQRAQLERQLAALRRQAQAAGQYRAAAAAAQEAEAALLSLSRARAQATHAAAAAGLDRAGHAVTEAAAAAQAAAETAARAGAALPALREAEAAAGLALERARAAQHALAADAARVRDALQAAAVRHVQVQRDLAHASQVQGDADGADARLAAEAERLTQEAADSPARIEAARAEAAEAAQAAEQAEARMTDAAGRAAALSSGAEALAALLQQAASRARRAEDTLGRLRAARTGAAQQAVPPNRIAAAQAEDDAAAAGLAEAGAQLDAAEAARAAAVPRAAAARAAADQAEAARAKLAAEASALGEVLAVRENGRWPPMLDQLQVPPGLEAALGAALGEDLAAAANPAAARHWRELPAIDAPALPASLGALVHGPAALARALGAVGLVDDEAVGDAAQPGLRPGQSLVSRAGAVWRWDGYTVRAGTPSAAAVRLRQRNRLAELQAQLEAAGVAAEAARAARLAADAAERDAARTEAQARPARRDAEQRAARARQAASALRSQAEGAAARLVELDAQIAPLETEAADAAAALAAAEAQRAALPDLAALRAELDRARADLAVARRRDAAAARASDVLSRDEAARAARSRVLSRERDDWRMRAEDAAGRVTDLAARAAEAEAEHARLTAAPDQVSRAAAEAAEALRGGEAAHRAAAQALAAGEREAAGTAQAARAAEQAVAANRDRRVRAEAAVEVAAAGLALATAQVAERLGAEALLPDPPSDLSQAAEDRARARFERQARARDAFGPVNLRAEIEAAALAEEAATILRDRDELAAAIAKLRGGIGHLNREGRDRLGRVFLEVDRRFQALFARVFDGGRAHLALVGSDDPLAAGLEIYAQPPGKKLSALSLLSGGEQALTALSLVFAVFQCNPAPVCVLDEVDAPLDDANVDRFCALLADMVRQTGTRFLVVTHHQLTMARMDRLYGVTMQERGVSRVLSVDLRAAVSLVEAAE